MVDGSVDGGCAGGCTGGADDGGAVNSEAGPAETRVLKITDVLSLSVLEVCEYVREDGRCPFARWLRHLSMQAAAKVVTATERMREGNLSNAKAVGAGVHEYRIDFGPGYRVYFGRDGARIVILLPGGTKKSQPEDIRAAQARWGEYKRRKREGE